MDLLLWRHAEAEDGSPDHARELTARGRNQARRMAGWLQEHGPERLVTLCSPTARTRQTTAAFSEAARAVDALGPGGDVAGLLAAAGWPDAGGAVLVVGHQPMLGRTAALLLAGHEADWTIKKGALWWLTNRVRDGQTRTVLRAVISPDLA